MTACRECGATLRFVRMETGKAMPCNAIADKTGNVAARRHPSGKGHIDGYVITPKRPLAAGFDVFRPHFADCSMRNARTTPRTNTPKPIPSTLF